MRILLTSRAGNGSFAAARQLARKLRFADFSYSKTQGILGYSTDISQEQDLSDDEEGAPPTPKSPSRRSKRTRVTGQSGPAGETKLKCQVLMAQGRTYLDLESLFKALDAMDRWKDLAEEAEQYTSRQQDGRAWSERKGPFNKTFGEVETNVQRLLHEWLQYPRNSG